MKIFSINSNFTTGEMKYMNDFNKINKDINENTFDKESIIEEIDYLIKKIKLIVPEKKSIMINMLNIIKYNIQSII